MLFVDICLQIFRQNSNFRPQFLVLNDKPLIPDYMPSHNHKVIILLVNFIINMFTHFIIFYFLSVFIHWMLIYFIPNTWNFHSEVLVLEVESIDWWQKHHYGLLCGVSHALILLLCIIQVHSGVQVGFIFLIVALFNAKLRQTS